MHTAIIGIRADEIRVGYKGKKPPVFSQRPNIIPVYPLKENGIKLNVNLEAIDFTDEEGTLVGLLGSAVLTGRLHPEVEKSTWWTSKFARRLESRGVI